MSDSQQVVGPWPSLQECLKAGVWEEIRTDIKCHIDYCKMPIPIGTLALSVLLKETKGKGIKKIFYCEACSQKRASDYHITLAAKPKKQKGSSSRAIAKQEHTCCNDNCKAIIAKGDVCLKHTSGYHWCSKCWNKYAGRPGFNHIPKFTEKEEQQKDMNPFETLSNKDKAIAISKRFNLKMDDVQTWTLEKMVNVWRSGKLDGETTPVTDVKLEGVSEKRVNELIDAKTPSIVQKARDSMAPAMQELKELILSKREVHVEVVKGEWKKIGFQHFKFDDVMKLVNLQLNVWMGGPAGAGKTYLASEIAKTLNKKFFRISCGPQTSASQIFGHTTAHGGYAPGIAYQAIKADGNGAILLFDEFDRLNPAVAVMVNGLLDGNSVTFPNGETLRLGENGCIALVAANTFGKPTAEFGTAQRQDIATMSRFVKILVPVDEKLEMALFGPVNEDWVKFVQKVRGVVSRLGITSLVVTPRASEYGVKMLANGMGRKNVEDLLLWNGVPTEDIKKIKSNL